MHSKFRFLVRSQGILATLPCRILRCSRSPTRPGATTYSQGAMVVVGKGDTKTRPRSGIASVGFVLRGAGFQPRVRHSPPCFLGKQLVLRVGNGEFWATGGQRSSAGSKKLAPLCEFFDGSAGDRTPVSKIFHRSSTSLFGPGLTKRLKRPKTCAAPFPNQVTQAIVRKRHCLCSTCITPVIALCELARRMG